MLDLNFTTLASGRPSKHRLRDGLPLLPDAVLRALRAAVVAESDRRPLIDPALLPPLDGSKSIKFVDPRNTAPTDAELAEWKAGRHIDAIKMYRGRTGERLRAAKDALEFHEKYG